MSARNPENVSADRLHRYLDFILINASETVRQVVGFYLSKTYELIKKNSAKTAVKREIKNTL